MQPTDALDRWLSETQTTGDALAGQVGCHKSVISRIRNGKTRPGFELARRIVATTGGAVRLADLGYPGVDAEAA